MPISARPSNVFASVAVFAVMYARCSPTEVIITHIIGFVRPYYGQCAFLSRYASGGIQARSIQAM